MALSDTRDYVLAFESDKPEATRIAKCTAESEGTPVDTET